MSPDVAAGVVAMLFTAAGRRPGQAEISLWVNALADLGIEPDDARAVATELIQTTDMWEHPPTPKLFRDQVGSWRRRNAYAVPARELPAMAEAGPPPQGRSDPRLGRVAELRATLARTKPPAGVATSSERGGNQLWIPASRQ